MADNRGRYVSESEQVARYKTANRELKKALERWLEAHFCPMCEAINSEDAETPFDVRCAAMRRVHAALEAVEHIGSDTLD